MRNLMLASAIAGATILAACAPMAPIAATFDEGPLRIAATTPLRSPANVMRDRYRHPVETLAFFGVRPSDSVVEIWPGGGWYSEILAPYLAQGGGSYIGAASERGLSGLNKLVAAQPAAYGGVRTAAFPVLAAGGTPVAAGSADVVLTFRNVHNWMMGDKPFEAQAFAQMYAMLKPGGTLGVVEHRLPENANAEREKKSGYVKVSTVRRLAETAGFRMVAMSEINANPLDNTDYPDGVWTLPPTYTLKDKDRARYAAIGESDRMTIRFMKPR
ncbi:MAG: methyltransferase [Sphingomonas bacterium]|nr:methyltransferase [Sphingomonas bacterium]